MSFVKEQSKTYNSFAGTDIVATITIPGIDGAIVIGELQTISYSIHREVIPVRTLGRINPSGFTKGPRTIAGSLIFTVFNRSIVYEVLNHIIDGTSKEEFSLYAKSIKENIVMDEMPPFDVTISMKNEYGQAACMKIKGIVIVDEGQVMSIEDLLTENTMSYMAQDIQVLEPVVDINTTVASARKTIIVEK